MARQLYRRFAHRDRVPRRHRDPQGQYEQVRDDGDPLDVLVLGQEPVYPLTIVEARAIGVLRMRDEKGVDDTIVAVSVRDPSYADYTDQAQLPPHMLRQVRRFFQDYRVLEQKEVLIEDLLGPEDARHHHGGARAVPEASPGRAGKEREEKI